LSMFVPLAISKMDDYFREGIRAGLMFPNTLYVSVLVCSSDFVRSVGDARKALSEPIANLIEQVAEKHILLGHITGYWKYVGSRSPSDRIGFK
jgi:hypothetical protein